MQECVSVRVLPLSRSLGQLLLCAQEAKDAAAAKSTLKGRDRRSRSKSPSVTPETSSSAPFAGFTSFRS